MKQKGSLARRRWEKVHPLFRKLYLTEPSAETELNERRTSRHRARRRQIVRSA
jgi:hypothetical protein